MPIAKFRRLGAVHLRIFSMVWFIGFTHHAFATMEEKALEVLEKTSAYYQGLENFTAVYNLTIKYPGEEMEQSSKIQITARGPQYRISYDQKETITDGETIWVYDKELKEVTISEYAQTDCTINFAELYNIYQQGYVASYKGVHVLNNKRRHVRDIVTLLPTSEDSSIKNITFEIDRSTAQIHQWEIVQNEETRYICSLRNFKENIALSDDYFTFDLKAHGALEIIDLREDRKEPDDSDASESSVDSI